MCRGFRRQRRQHSALKNSNLPPRLGRRQDNHVVRSDLASAYDFALVAKLDLELNSVNQLNRQPLRGVKQDAEIMRLVSIECLDSEPLLVLNRVRQLLFGRANEVSVKHFRLVLLKCANHRLPCAQVVSGQGLLSLPFHGSRPHGVQGRDVHIWSLKGAQQYSAQDWNKSRQQMPPTATDPHEPPPQ